MGQPGQRIHPSRSAARCCRCCCCLRSRALVVTAETSPRRSHFVAYALRCNTAPIVLMNPKKQEAPNYKPCSAINSITNSPSRDFESSVHIAHEFFEKFLPSIHGRPL